MVSTHLQLFPKWQLKKKGGGLFKPLKQILFTKIPGYVLKNVSLPQIQPRICQT